MTALRLTVKTLRAYTHSVGSRSAAARERQLYTQVLLYQVVAGSGSDPEVEMRSLTQVHDTTKADARQDALVWLRSQLRWERMLGEMRSYRSGAVAKQAA